MSLLFVCLGQSFTVTQASLCLYRSIAWNFWSTFLYLQSAGIAGVRPHTPFSVILGRETRVSTLRPA